MEWLHNVLNKIELYTLKWFKKKTPNSDDFPLPIATNLNFSAGHKIAFSM